MKPFRDEILIPIRTRTTSSERPDSKWIASYFVAGVEVCCHGPTRLAALRGLQADITKAQERWTGNVQPQDEYATCRYKDGNGVSCPRLKSVDDSALALVSSYCDEHAGA